MSEEKICVVCGMENEVSEEKICVVCGMENDVAYRICRMPQCGGTLVKAKKPYIKNAAKPAEPVTQNDASSFKEKVTLKPNEVSVKPREPKFVSRNSYETILKVMRRIGHKAGRGKAIWKKGQRLDLSRM